VRVHGISALCPCRTALIAGQCVRCWIPQPPALDRQRQPFGDIDFSGLLSIAEDRNRRAEYDIARLIGREFRRGACFLVDKGETTSKRSRGNTERFSAVVFVETAQLYKTFTPRVAKQRVGEYLDLIEIGPEHGRVRHIAKTGTGLSARPGHGRQKHNLVIHVIVP
jgi:hypothetical protein